ncbi:MAG: TRAP transporter small permease [Burkholderiaceae bacterium]|nr:TRAP transporter small permease [Burkholderiaceae bacterium]
MRWFVSFMDRVAVGCAIIAALLLATAVVVICWMVIYRAMGNSTYWEIEFAVYAMVGAIFLASPYTLKTNGHVSVDLLPHYLSPRAAKILGRFTAALGLAVCAYLAWAGGAQALHAWTMGETTESAWAPPKWPLYASMPLGLGLTALQYLAEMWREPAAVRAST